MDEENEDENSDGNENKAMAPLTTMYFYHPDHLGTSTALTDFNGVAYQFFLNLPFGETMAEQSQLGLYNTPYKFNGKELDNETGFYYYGARYYDPRISIWASVDPLAEKGPEYSPYCFTFNNPINLTDPDGRWPWPTWSNVKQYYSGMWQGAKQTYKATAHAIAHPIETAKRIYNSAAPKQDIADVIGSNSGLLGQAVTPFIRSTLQALKGDYKGAGMTNGAALADASIQGATVVVGAVAGKGLSLLAKGATAETTSLFRAVSSAELGDITANGLKTVQGGYELEKLFTTTAENAAQFGKNNFTFDGIPNTIIEAKVPQSVMGKAFSFTADGMPAVSIPAEQLQNIKTIIPATSSPIVK